MRQTAAESRIETIAAKYWRLTDTIVELEKEKARHKEAIEEWLADNNEDGLLLEGLGELRLQRTRVTTYDLTAADDLLFNRLRELNCLKVDATTLKRMEERGLITMVKAIRNEGEQTRLVRDSKKR